MAKAMTLFRKTILFVFCLGVSSLYFAAAQATASTSDKVSVYFSASVNTNLLTQAAVAVARFSRLEVELAGTWAASDSLAVGEPFATIAFVESLASGETLEVDSEKHSMLINYAAISGAEGEILQRRMERLMMRGLAALCELGFCPNRQCCLYDYESLSQLDQMGRNFCPPCSGRYDAKMKEMNITLVDPRAVFLEKMKALQKSKAPTQ